MLSAFLIPNERTDLNEREDTKMKWTLFVLDFDGTYDNEYDYEDGAQPLVYLVPTSETKRIGAYAKEAHNDFHSDDSGSMCIGDYFEEWLDNNGIDYRRVGSLNLTFGERRGEYLSTEIEMEVV